MRGRAALFALVCALTGLAASAGGAYTHYHLIHDPAYHSFCDVSETISCTQVYQSRFSTVAGVPVAIFGAIAFVAAALLAVGGLTAGPELRASVPGYLLILSTLSLAAVLYLGFASFVLIKAVCLLCLTTYAAVIGLFMVSAAATTVSMTSMLRRSRTDLRALAASPLAMALALLFVTAAGGTVAFFPREAVSAAGVPEPLHQPSPHRHERSGSNAGTRLSRACRSSSQRRGPGADREVQRLPVPRVRAVVPAIQAGSGQVRS
jgi:vitamin-K-epoxide reductase (warfarin-sensitive)